MCKGTTHGEEHCYYIPRKNFGKEMLKRSKREGISVDKCIGEEIEYLLNNGIASIGHSCCGHGKLHSQVWIYREYKEQCEQLGYTVVEYDKERTRDGIFACLLKTGTQNKPVKFEWYVHGNY